MQSGVERAVATSAGKPNRDMVHPAPMTWIRVGLLWVLILAPASTPAVTYGNLVLQRVEYVVAWGLVSQLGTNEPTSPTLDSGSVSPAEPPKQVDFDGPTEHDALGQGWCFDDYFNDISMSGSTTFDFPEEMPYVWEDGVGRRLTTTPTFTLSTTASFDIANAYGCEFLMRINYSEDEGTFFETTTTNGYEGTHTLTLTWSGTPQRQLGETVTNTSVFFKVYTGAVSYYGDYLKRYILLRGIYDAVPIPDLVQIESITPASGTVFKPGDTLDFAADILYQRSENDRLYLNIVYRDAQGDVMQQFSGPAVDAAATTDGSRVHLTYSGPAVPYEDAMPATIDVYAEFEEISVYDSESYTVTAIDKLTMTASFDRERRPPYAAFDVNGIADYKLESAKAAAIYIGFAPEYDDKEPEPQFQLIGYAETGEGSIPIDPYGWPFGLDPTDLAGVHFWLTMQSLDTGEVLTESDPVFVAWQRNIELIPMIMHLLLQ